LSTNGQRLGDRRWFGALLLACVIIAYTLWYVLFNFQFILLFLIITIVALSFVAIVSMLKKYRQRLIKAAISHNSRRREWPQSFQLLREAALAVIIAGALAFPIALELLPSLYQPFFIVIFVVVELAAGAVFAVALLKTSKRLGIVYLAILVAAASIGLIVGLIHNFG
jgi:hypothetical protein